MISTIAEGVNIRQSIHQATEDLLTDRMLSQISSEIEAYSEQGNSIIYKGPMQFAFD
jgi:hypothetical protein